MIYWDLSSEMWTMTPAVKKFQNRYRLLPVVLTASLSCSASPPSRSDTSKSLRLSSCSTRTYSACKALSSLNIFFFQEISPEPSSQASGTVWVVGGSSQEACSMRCSMRIEFMGTIVDKTYCGFDSKENRSQKFSSQEKEKVCLTTCGGGC